MAFLAIQIIAMIMITTRWRFRHLLPGRYGDNKLWKILREMGIPDNLTCLLRNLYAGQEQQLELDMEQTASNQGQEYVKAIYCHPAYLTYMQST